ncbi:unnamed protein product [Clonostachys rosea]|uniref:Heterokaryon incompatibility domain-containing protein n=1 Tax=Bionectria ochroleuca TaxID=29856 RepID=A0ABY6UUX7_BIOOC|nr:unnamed protein product [Clonostachys rosea]
MRLINVRNYQLETFVGSNIPPYAILSHTWGDNEITFEKMPLQVTPEAEDTCLEEDLEGGYMKIIYVCKQALSDGLNYAWVDTCCIDKSSSAELTEAINSMFQWYHQAAVCYAYLSDIENGNRLHGMTDPRGIRRSKWFSRGWTLQELLAPMKLQFFVRGWRFVGAIDELQDIIAERTGIEKMYLTKDLSPLMCRHASVATRMSWAASRRTTRIEDQAYCLLGIFDVNMPLMYGEGDKAFIRLQEEIMKSSDDETILAWNWTAEPRTIGQNTHGYLAMSPKCFQGLQHLRPWPGSGGQANFSVTNRGLQVNLPVIHRGGDKYDAILRCNTKMDIDRAVRLPLVKLRSGHGGLWDRVPYFSRSDKATGIKFVGDDTLTLHSTTVCISSRPWWPQIVHDAEAIQGFYIRNLPAGCLINNTFPTDGWSPADKFATMIDVNDGYEPRYFFGSYHMEHFVISLEYESDRWVCKIAKNKQPSSQSLKETLARLTFGEYIEFMDRRLTVSAKMEPVMNGFLIVIDLSERTDWVREFGGVLLGILGAGATLAALGSVTARKKKAK